MIYTVGFPCEDKATSEYNKKLDSLLGLGVLALATRRFPSQGGEGQACTSSRLAIGIRP